MHAAALDLRQQQFEFTVPNQWIATHQRDVERLVLIDQRKHSYNEFIALEVGEFVQLAYASEMRRIEGVASRAPQGAFLGDFDRKRRRATGQNPGPCVKNFGFFHYLSISDAAGASGNRRLVNGSVRAIHYGCPER
jgi:hypothetical protein